MNVDGVLRRVRIRGPGHCAERQNYKCHLLHGFLISVCNDIPEYKLILALEAVHEMSELALPAILGAKMIQSVRSEGIALPSSTSNVKRRATEIATAQIAAPKIVAAKIAAKRPEKTTTGLRYWMQRVLEECDHVSTDFSADLVHDLRVSVRRCRSMADGLIAVDPDPDWKAMKKTGKRLFQRLGDLRDIQVMMEWIEKLHPAEAVAVERVVRGVLPALPPSQQNSVAIGDVSTKESRSESQLPTASQPHLPRDPAAQALLETLGRREAEQKREARAALGEFDRKQWRQWSRTLPQRAAHIRPGSGVFKHLALERWTAARDLHNRALRNRSKVAFHTLRIGIKRFRYIVENFLPEEHKAWSNDLKTVQDLLGEVHDLDVLWATALTSQIFSTETFSNEISPGESFRDEILSKQQTLSGAESRERWHRQIAEERAKRIERYRKKMVGPDSLWNVWRRGLPQGKQIQALATQRMKLWAKALDPDFAHSEHVVRLALELYDGLAARRLLGAAAGSRLNPATGPGMSRRTNPANASGARASLLMAALLHDVGKSKGNKGHHKASQELIKAHSTPLGWNARDMQRAATVARFHSGALPTPSHKALRDLLPDEQKTIIQLAAIVRLANALDASHDGHIRRIEIENGQSESSRIGSGKLGSEARRPRRTNGFLQKPAVGLAKNEALIIAAEGYIPGSPTAQTIAAERHLLETMLGRAVIVRAMKNLTVRR
jgi:CHAD domain-containing protein